MSRWSPLGGRLPDERELWCEPSVVLGASGPQRVAREDDADPAYEPPRVLGFSVADVDLERLRRAVLASSWSVDDFRPEPLLWEGDQA